MTKNTATVAYTMAPSLATLASASTKTRRVGTKLRYYTALTALYSNSPVKAALVDLLKAGVKAVKVYHVNTIGTAHLNPDGSLGMSYRNTFRFRPTATVEVVM